MFDSLREPITCCRWVANSPSMATVRGQFVNSLFRMPYVTGSVNTDMDSVTLAPDTLIILSLEPVKMVTTTQSQVTEGTRKVGSPQCAWKETRSLRSRPQCPSMCHLSTLPLGTCQIQILTTFQKFLQRPSHHPVVLATYGVVDQRQGHHDQTSFCTLLRTRWSCTL